MQQKSECSFRPEVHTVPETTYNSQIGLLDKLQHVTSKTKDKILTARHSRKETLKEFLKGNK